MQLEEGLGRFHAQYRQDRPQGADEDGLANEQFLFGGENIDGSPTSGPHARKWSRPRRPDRVVAQAEAASTPNAA